jgi:acetyl esterase/lipase
MYRTIKWFVVPSLLVLVWAGVPLAQPPGGASPLDNQRRPGRGGPGGRFQLPETVKVVRDINYAGTSNPAQTLDVLLPKKPASDKPLPVVVNIHGGAFRMGDKGMGVNEIAGLVASGDYAGVTINYRLSGEAIWPAQIHDCKAAIRWVRANAAKYDFDPERIGVIGGSAGGHLVAMLGTGGGVDALEGSVGPHKDAGSKVRCVVDQFGPSDLLAMGDYPSRQDHNAANSPESQLIGGALQENKDKARAASPISYVSKDDPPFLIFHGTEDPLVPFNQSERLAKALREAGVDTLFVPVVGAGHGGFRSPEVPKRIRQFFDKHLRGVDVGTISEEPIPGDAAPRAR